MAHLEVQRETRCSTWICLQCAEVTVGLVQCGSVEMSAGSSYLLPYF
jgi:hypothetical protein